MTVRRLLKWTAILLPGMAIILYALLLAGLWALQDQILFGRSSREIKETPSARGWPYEEVWCAVGDEKTHGWWIPVPEARGAVLFSHGSGRNISGYLEDAALFREQRLSVLLYDYGGYGSSTGKASEPRCYADGLAMWEYLVKTLKIPPEKILLAGSSLGGGVATELATRVAPAAVVLESTFTSIPDALSDAYPFIPADWICHLQFRNKDKMAGIPCPVLLFHSRDDTVVPFAHGRQLFENATEPKQFVEIRGAHHGGKFASRDVYSESLKQFIGKYL
ncbi:MAG TPA: alpha/beta hydrolase [Candidatus Hydrogenedentes bacterium]|nr:MAG: putative aminoacrylate hydrolase RutD [Candidatus Hydrogenedentes bacterium ADurb.Bin179]HOH30238.1 alpha/beta hydrolase [Candidatus Hydrogenedentota bacterium]